MTDTERALKHLPLDRLIPSPDNVRKTPAQGSAFDQLKASIAAHGVLENLLVRPIQSDADSGIRYEVVAGGRRLAALRALADEGHFVPDHPVPCHVLPDDSPAAELSLTENTVRAAMHPADQVEAFAKLARDGATVPEIAARFGVAERMVEQRLRLGNAAPKLLDAYRAGDMGLQALQAFCVTADAQLQLAVWEELKAQHYGPSVWQIRRLLTEGRLPGNAAVALFVGAAAYEEAGGMLTRDLFAEDDEHGTWFDDPALLRKLALKKLEAVAEKLRSEWSWVEPRIEVDWSDTARYAQIRPRPGEPTADETKEAERLTARRDELTELDDDQWTEEAESEHDRIEARLEEIQQAVADRAEFSDEDRKIAGAIVTVSDDGNLRVIRGLVRPEDLPAARSDNADAPEQAAGTTGPGASHGTTAARGDPDDRIRPPTMSAPAPDPAAVARKRTGIGIGLGDDLRAIRTALVKTGLALYFDAAFDLCLFQMARAVFAPGYRPHALDIAVSPTPDRPIVRRNDEDFAAVSPGEAMLERNRDGLPLEWLTMEDDREAFQALCELSDEQKQSLFASCVAHTVNGQLAFEPSARPELEATVARLDMDFAGFYRPDADIFWSRLTKARILQIAGNVLGLDWAAARAKLKKPELVSAVARAFAHDPEPASYLPAVARAKALKWTPPGFEAFDTGELAADAKTPESSAEDGTPNATAAGEPDAPPHNGDAATAEPANDAELANGSGSVSAPANGENRDAPVTEVPAFLRVSP